ncbi:MAG: glyceraldehyde-3-phosphate dehydrogenase 1 [Thelocarpon superellum]|nr:MAG: glyceraldehyde-3-phosphate dehydrogenase 1 [Thelocarpon superellum]
MNWLKYNAGAPGQMTRDVVDSFRRDPNARALPPGMMRSDDKGWDLEDAYEATAHSGLARQLKSRHLQMIAIGSAIGACYFVTTGHALAQAGPGSLTLAFFLVGTAVFCTVQALGEMAVLFPVAGSFSAYSTRFLDPAWGFAMGWNYALQWIAVIPFEIVAGSIAFGYWTNGRVSNVVWIVVYLVGLAILNCFSVRMYGEAEFVFTSIKVTAIVGFIIFALVIDLGGGPQGQFIGGRYWHDPGAFINGFKGFATVVPAAAFCWVGAELVGLCAAETRYPRQSIPSAIRKTFWYLCFCYVIGTIMFGLIVSAADAQLNAPATAAGSPSISPFIIAIKNSGVRGLDSVFNAVIIVATFEVANSSLYASTRTMAALAEQRQAPAFLAYIDRKGRPMAGVLVCLCVGLLAFLGSTSADAQITVLVWIQSISSLAGIVTWASICLCHIRFRQAWKYQGHSLDELAFRSSVGVWGSAYAFVIFVWFLILQLWTAIEPIGYELLGPSDRASYFFQTYLTIPVIIAFWVFYKVLYRTQVVRIDNMNLSIGVLKLTLEQIREEERAQRMKPAAWWKGFSINNARLFQSKEEREMDWGFRAGSVLE